MKIVWAGSCHTFEVSDRIALLVASDPKTERRICRRLQSSASTNYELLLQVSPWTASSPNTALKLPTTCTKADLKMDDGSPLNASTDPLGPTLVSFLRKQKL